MYLLDSVLECASRSISGQYLTRRNKILDMTPYMITFMSQNMLNA